MLLCARTVSGTYYFTELNTVGQPLSLLGQIHHLTAWGPYFESFGNFTNRIYTPSNDTWWSSSAYLGMALSTILWAILSPKGLPKPFYHGVAAVTVTFYLINRTKLSWAGHHIIFVFAYFLLGTAWALSKLERTSRKTALFLASTLAIIGVVQLKTVLKRSPYGNSSFDVLAVNAYLSKPEVAEKM